MICVKLSSASRPTPGGAAYHVGLSAGQMPGIVLLPGDPGRVKAIASVLSDPVMLASHREFVSARGTWRGVDIGVCSTGIGAPSAAIAVEELAALGCHTFLRVGSTGAIGPGISCGDLIINTAAVRMESTSLPYVVAGYPAHAHYEAVNALIESCSALQAPFHVGICASTDSFYVGQGRPGLAGYLPSAAERLIPDLARMQVLNFEMEAAALFTLGSVYGLRTGSVCAVFADRNTDTFAMKGEDEAIRAAVFAASLLATWDAKKARMGVRYLPPSHTCTEW